MTVATSGREVEGERESGEVRGIDHMEYEGLQSDPSVQPSHL